MNSEQQRQLQRQQQQPFIATTQMLPPTALHVTSTGDVQMQAAPVISTAGYIGMPTTAGNISTVETYQSTSSKVLGIVLIIVALLAILFNIIALVLEDSFAQVGHGFWSSVMFILAGAFGIAAANKRRCLIITFMILSIISAILSVAMLGAAVGGMFECGRKRCGYIFYTDDYCGDCYDVAIAMEVLLAILAVMATITSIWSSAICCRAVCCCVNTSSSVITSPYGNQQVLIIGQHQQQQQLGAVQMSTTCTPMAYSTSGMAPHPQQYWPAGSMIQQPQYAGPQFGYEHASAPSVDEMQLNVEPMTPPPDYSTVEQKTRFNS